MKKGFYVFKGSGSGYYGVEKKIDNQIKALSSFFDTRKIIIEKEDAGFFEHVLWCLPGGSWGAKYERAFDQIKSQVEDVDEELFFYIRMCSPDKRFVSFLRRIREFFSKSQIILEIPTYPYANDLIRSKTMWPWFFKDIANRRAMADEVDRIVTFSDNDMLLGKDTIRIINGIDVETVPFNETSIIDEKQESHEISLLAVANFQLLHGYERILKGLAKYYEKNNAYKVVIHMVGDGKERNYYQSLVIEYGLEEYVSFYGLLTGDDLEGMYSSADIGLGVFGAYKRDIHISSALKTREYLAYGLPVVSGVYEDAFPQKNEFFLEMVNDDSIVCIDEIVSFYQRIFEKYGKKEVRKKVRDYARRTVDVAVTMSPVINYLET